MTLHTQTLQLEFFFFFPMDNRNLLLYVGNHSRQQYVTFVWNIGSFTDKLALFLWYGNYGRWWGYYSCTLSYVKVNSCCINGKVLILNTRIACPLLLKIKWQWESKAGEQRGGRREKQPKMRVGLRNTDNWSVPFTKRLLSVVTDMLPNWRLEDMHIYIAHMESIYICGSGFCSAA